MKVIKVKFTSLDQRLMRVMSVCDYSFSRHDHTMSFNDNLKT